MHGAYAAMDEALAMLAGSGPEYGGGLSNHGPMAAEALCALARPDAVTRWVERYRSRLDARPRATQPISQAQWRAALGQYRRVGDWSEFFTARLDAAPWREVLGVWSARLAPGISAAAFHGVLRTAHAVRSLAENESRARLNELAQGLGYWAASYQELPTGQGGDSREPPSRAIEEVEFVPAEKKGRAGLLSDGLAALADFPPFASAIGRVDTSGAVPSFISDLTETFAGVYLVNSSSFLTTIAFIHTVTGPAAVRLMLPHMDDAAGRTLARYAWQACAAMYAAFGRNRPSMARAGDGAANRDDSRAEPKRNDLIDRAVANGDEHAIKFTEACLREYSLNPKPVYLSAAAHALEFLPPLK